MARVIKVGTEAFGNGSFEPIPVGTKLRVAVFDIKEGETGPNSKKPGSPQFEYTAKVVEDGPYKGRELRYNYVPLDPEASNAWVLVAFAEAVGWKTSKEEGVEVPDDLSDVLGTEFLARIGQRTSQKIDPETGKPYINNTIQGTQKIKEGGGGKPETPEDLWGTV